MPIVKLENITKTYPGVKALDNVSFSLKSSEIHALLGENGAGKSTLMKILYGMTNPDKGVIKIKGKEVCINNTLDAIGLGIGMVHQHFMLADALSVLENIIVGSEPMKGNKVDYEKAKEDLNRLIDEFSFNLDLDRKVKELSVGEKQRVEILKVLYRGADILILDEPTAVLNPLEVDNLFKILRELKREGKSIIIITHKLYEVTEIADSVTVLRDGIVTGHADPKIKTAKELATMMVGRELKSQYNRFDNGGEKKVSLKHISYKKSALDVLKNINLDIYSGEIVGIAGVEGNGQSELALILTGQIEDYEGDIFLNNKKIRGNTKDFLNENIGHIPEDRLSYGVVEDMTIYENIILGYHDKKEFSNDLIMNKENIKNYAEEKIEEYDIKVSSSEDLISELSGGNQQKVVLSRVISQNPDFLVCCQPTRGVDVGATEYIHNKLIEYRNNGNSMLLISADLEEIKALSDRIAVIYKGKIVAIKNKNEFTDTELGILMTGGNID